MARLPLSIQAIEAGGCANMNDQTKRKAYSSWMWVLTFFIYCSYHLSRKPISVVKNVLNQNCSQLTPPQPTNDSHWCDWKPFDGQDSATLLGFIDSAFLFAYAFGMFFSGIIAERMDLRIFLSFGMILSGAFCAMFGLGYTFKVHALWFYLVAQAFCGLVQTTGWPGVVTALGNWFGKGNRGLIFGIWNSHTSLGNILGTLIAAAFVSTNWSLSFIIPGLIIASVGVVAFFFLVPSPDMVGLPDPNAVQESATVSYVEKEKEKEEEARASEPKQEEKAIGFFQALRIPGVIEFSMCLFFAKLVSYTFLYWLPNFILNNTKFDAEESANLSTFFDVGGIVGGILAGYISDKSGMSATTCVGMLIVAIPMMFVYQAYSDVTLGLNIFLLVVVGLLVNGPYALITTAVSADLGTHESLTGNAKALATVTAIIDGTGSIGAAVGPLIAGPISAIGWDYVFYMLMCSDLIALLLLLRLLVVEVRTYRRKRNTPAGLGL